MRKLLLGMALTLPIALISQASAMPAANPFLRDAAVSVDLIEVDLIEVKGGHGWGRGHGVIVRLVVWSLKRLSSVRPSRLIGV